MNMESLHWLEKINHLKIILLHKTLYMQKKCLEGERKAFTRVKLIHANINRIGCIACQFVHVWHAVRNFSIV